MKYNSRSIKLRPLFLGACLISQDYSDEKLPARAVFDPWALKINVGM